MSEEHYWSIFFALVAVVLCTLIVSVTYGIQATNEKILRADSCEKVAALVGSTLRVDMLCIAKAVRP